MKTMTLMPLLAALVTLAPTSFAADKAAAVTMKGEVVDMSCYMGHGAMGAKHKDCAKACLKGGGPAGLLGADGSLTLLTQDHSKQKAYKQATELAGEQVEVTGEKTVKGGITALAVASVKKA